MAASLENRVREMELTIAQLQRELARQASRPAAPLQNRLGWWLAKLDEDLDPGGDAVASVWIWSITDGEWKDSDINITVSDDFLTSDGKIAAGTRVRLDWYRNKWIANRVKDDDFVWFELTADLTPLASHAAANKLDADLADTGTDIEVFDPYTAPGMWRGASGYKGLARKTSGTTGDPARANYNIVWMETLARWIRFTLTEDLATGEAAATVDHYHLQGKDPGATVHVFDPTASFQDAVSGWSGWAHYNDRDDHYEVVSVQLAADRAFGTLTGRLCRDDATLDAANFGSWSTQTVGDFIADVPKPDSILNTLGLAGESGDVFYCERITNNASPFDWILTSIQPRGIWGIEFELTEDMGYSAAHAAAAKVTASFGRTLAVDTVITVHDDNGLFPMALSGAKGTALSDGTCADEAYWRIVTCEQMVERGEATLAEALCKDTASVTITGFGGWPISPYNQEPDPLPTTASNPRSHQGKSGNKVTLLRSGNGNAWNIIDVDKQVGDRLVDVFIEAGTGGGPDLLKKTYIPDEAFEACEDPTTETIVEINPCPTE